MPYFIVEKLAHRPRAIFVYSVLCLVEPNILEIAEEIFRRHTIRERAAFEVLSQRYLRPGRTNHRSIRIT